MDRTVRYLHKFEQIAGELRDAADDVEKHLVSLRDAADEPYRALRARHEEFMRCGIHKEVIDDLTSLVGDVVGEVQRDESSIDRKALESDMLAANEHAIRLCAALLAVTQLLTAKKDQR